ncbi:MAG: S9 family peptidase [Terracidiphilus sp.]
MFQLKRAALVLCLVPIAICPSFAASPDGIPPQLAQQLDAIFNKHEFIGRNPELAWQNGGDSYSILEAASDGKGVELAVYDTATGKRGVPVSPAQLTPPGAKGPLQIESYAWSYDNKKLLIFTNSKRVWRENTRGDYWVFDTSATTPEARLTKLGGDAPESTLMFATFSPDGSRVAYVRANNLYAEDLATRKITQLTTDGSADIINGTSDWVNEEELFLRDCFHWSPDSRSIAYWQFDQSGVGEYTLINDTEAEYPVTEKYKYPQPGTTNSAVRVGIVAAAGGPTRWIKLAGDPRQHYVAQMDWAGNNGVVIEYLDRLQKTNQFIWADARTGDTRVITDDTDKTWVDVFPLTWIGQISVQNSNPDSAKDFIFLSERDGWRHAWRVDPATGQPKLITRFEGDILEKSAVDEKGGWFYFLASPGDATRQYLYRSRLDGQGVPERVTPADEPGHHDYQIAPNGRWAVHIYSTADRPPRVEIVSLPDHKPVRTLVDNDDLAAKVQPLLGSKTEFFQVKIDNGVTLDGWMIKPPDFDPAKKYPVLANVYGEPWGATVRDGWHGAGRLFHGALAEQGYIIVSFDNQGTPAPKGREWRKCIYGAIGVLSSAQQAQAIQELAREHSYIDTTRMAIWGWSGGGSNTLNVMFRYPGVYSTGIAVAPVADESHYDTIYQERYMGLPNENKQGDHDGSPINFAQGLAGNLLVIHGSGDDNVHFQGTELLVNKLVELGKPFTFMDYPNRTHGLFEGKGTSFHVYSLIARYLEEHVPPGGVAQ